MLGFDVEDLDILKSVSERTMTSPIQIPNSMNAARYVARNLIPGALVECGVWRGGTCMAMASALVALDACDRDIYLFDTFAGMTGPSEMDRRLLDGIPASQLGWEASESDRASHEFIRSVAAYSSMADVMAGMESTGYPRERIHLVQGDILDTFSESSPDQIALLRLDTDWYESTLHELRVAWPELSAGGILIIDDYDYWEGARRATDEYFSERHFNPFLMRTDEGRIAIKLMEDCF